MGEETLLSAIKGIPQLREVPDSMQFILRSGDSIRSLLELQVKFVKMPDEVFFHHVTPDRNDFAAWAYHAIGDAELAGQLGPAKTKAQNFLIIKNRVRNLVSERVMLKKQGI